MNKGYIGITDNNWAEFIKDNKIIKANFWCKKQLFKAIDKGDIFFFLKKNDDKEKKEKRERKIVGYGIFKEFEVLSIDDAWEKYDIGNGCSTIELFSKKINSMYNLIGDEVKIGSIILDEITMFEEPVYLSKLDIEFANAIVSGKTITIDEINRILNSLDIDEINRILNSLDIEVDYIEEYENVDIENIDIEEGEQIKRIINAKKRNSNARKLKLEQFKKEHGSVFCEVCKESDIVVLDVHHDLVQVSSMKEGHKTKLSDLRVVCANCHRKVHGYNTTVDELIKKY